MNKYIRTILIALVILALVGVFFGINQKTAHAVCDEDLGPTIATQLPSEITDDSAMLHVFFSSRDACYTDFTRPQIIFEFGETSNMTSQSNPIGAMLGSRTISIPITNLDAGTTYYYRAVMYYGNSIVKGDKVKFTTVGSSSGSGMNVTESNTILGGSSSGSSSNGVVANSGSVSHFPSSNSSSSTHTSSSQNNSVFSRPATSDMDSNGVASIAIDNDTDMVSQGEYVTYDIKYANLSSNRELEDAMITVTFPKGVEFISASGKARYNEMYGTVTMHAGDIEPKTADDFKIVVAVKKVQAMSLTAEVKMTYRDVVENHRATVRAIDEDELDMASYNAPLAAGLFASGFMPGNILGWIIVIILLGAIIYVVRAYFIKPQAPKYIAPEPQVMQSDIIGTVPRRA